MSHYKWLEAYLRSFFEKVDVNWDTCAGIIVAHGDKGYGYKALWEEAGISFHKGMAVYLLTYVSPYGNEAREQAGGEFIPPGQWVVDNYHRFSDILAEFPDEI